MITPARVFLPERARERFGRTAAACARLSAPPVDVTAAYSVKTNPRAELLAEALAHGFMAEVIAADELQWAFDCGFGPERVVYNGPAALPERPRRGAVAAAFADSVEAAARYAGAGVVGFGVGVVVGGVVVGGPALVWRVPGGSTAQSAVFSQPSR